MVLRKLVAGAAALAVLASCGGDDDSASDEEKLQVVASFYPLAWLAEEIGGDRVEVTDLTPAGGEPHDLELSPDQVDAIEDADLVMVMGSDFQPAVEEAAARRDGETLVALDLVMESDDLLSTEDPHLWLSPGGMAHFADLAASAIAAADPDGQEEYAERSIALADTLAALDTEFGNGLDDCERRTIVTAHDAFGWLANNYGFEQLPIAGIEPNAEPGADRIAELADLVEEEGVTTIFTETLVSPEVAETLAREAGGLRTAVLNPIEGLTEDERDRGEDYLSLMRENLARLREALGCAS